MDAVLPVYEHAVNGAFYNGCVVAAVEAVLALLSAERRVVALEVGAGTGGTASSVLPILESACEWADDTSCCALLTDDVTAWTRPISPACAPVSVTSVRYRSVAASTPTASASVRVSNPAG